MTTKHDKKTKINSPVEVIDIDANDTQKIAGDIFADLEATLNEVAETNPRINLKLADGNKTTSDLQTLLAVTQAVNSSLVLDDVLQIVMGKAIELMQAERGLIMMLDDNNELQIRTAYNLSKKEMMQDEFKISNSVVNQVAESGKSVYASDTQSDERYAQQASVIELNLRSIMCVPIKEQDCVIGIIYVDNSNQARMFLKSDLYLFELYALAVAGAMRNAAHYDSLLKLKKYNESVINLSPIGMIVLNDKVNVATINSTALEILEINIDTVSTLGDEEPLSPFLELLHPEERARWRNMVKIAFATNQEYSEPRYFHNTGYIEKVLSVKISPTSALPSGENGLIITIEDITEKVLMEKYVILSEKLAAKGEMAASIAHELNNYLAIAATNAELISMNLDKERFDKARFNSKSIIDNVFKIKRFVDNLMDFAQPEPEYISYDIKLLIEEMLFSMRVQPRFKLIHFTINLNNNIPNLEIDVGQIQQVLMNLLNNAADAIEERSISEQDTGNKFKPEISIIASYDEETGLVSVEITDNGTGMTSETLEKLFTPHYTTKKGGHGLGLSNCRNMLENHKGDLTAKSTVGQGSVFTMTLPKKRT